ncbi:hypothetical protein [Devosia sp.]|uniref:hypothetical protein n=1 Tax=Devosia sp. TaxID=1871048 RepID=UPI0032673941
MAMASVHPHPEDQRTQLIASVISKELARQAPGASSGVDVQALAAAIAAALGGDHPAPDEGRHPDELNATNDD